MIGLFVTIAAVGLLLSMLLSPIETLGWWAGWYGHGLEDQRTAEERAPEPGAIAAAAHNERGRRPRQYVIYLDGIANVGGYQYQDVQGLLDSLGEALPDAVVVSDLMPYTVLGMTLLDPGRRGARWWRRMLDRKVGPKRSPISFTINMRNLYQVLVAADPRYGRIFGRGQAQQMVNALLSAGYEPGSGVPVTIVGYSGGAQVGVAAVPFLKSALGAHLTMISLAGVVASEPGLDYLDRMFHLQSPTDKVPSLGAILFPGRWPFMRWSHWNRMVRSGRLLFVNMGPMKHNGPGGYLDEGTVHHGDSNLEVTARVIAGIARGVPSAPPPVSTPAAR